MENLKNELKTKREYRALRAKSTFRSNALNQII